MKIVIIPLVEQETANCDCFQHDFLFKKEWCLDLHGFLSRNEFAAQLNDINNYIRNFPLLSDKTKNFILGIFIVLILIMFSIAPANIGAFIIVESFLLIGLSIAYYQVNKIAKLRAEKFSAALNNNLFAQYNLRDNPTANWRLQWSSHLTHYKIHMMDGEGEITPKYAQQAEIVLEINDALSDLTAQTVRVRLAPNDTPSDLTARTVQMYIAPNVTPSDFTARTVQMNIAPNTASFPATQQNTYVKGQ